MIKTATPLPPNPEVIVYGTVCLDRFVFVDADGKARPGEALEMPGGEAFNTATALAGWGVRVLLTGTALGSDAESDRLRHLLDLHPLGVARDFIPDITEAVTPVCTVSVFPDGERKMRGRGYAQAVAPPPLPEEILQSRPLYVCDPNLGPPAVAAARRAAALGCPVVAMDCTSLPEVVAVSRILVTSREMLAKQGFLQEPARLARSLVAEAAKTGAQTAIITCGAAGGVVCDRDEGEFSFPAFPLPGIVDTTGAGDAFRAGLTFRLLREMALPEIIRFAAAAAALHCQVLGGGSRIPLSKVQALASRDLP